MGRGRTSGRSGRGARMRRMFLGGLGRGRNGSELAKRRMCLSLSFAMIGLISNAMLFRISLLIVIAWGGCTLLDEATVSAAEPPATRSPAPATTRATTTGVAPLLTALTPPHSYLKPA